ncbi:Avr9/Cf-9 rapidly elicited protein 189 [Heracleum sosnowskyi]|uniref:Avr9/Cf-9 rapidly elicited protein 189 n=1 Tax=Heracleum sosnowskyi TaxID=360622 RepID=A0AAD8I4G0_9APIA|nr:Avr9/Cf-9 rapidly elicited protein 189 [Heracleum sosnowskyi]
MGQCSSFHAVQIQTPTLNLKDFLNSGDGLISELPDECLALIFQSLGSGDRKACSLVCRRWFVIEGQSREKLNIKSQSSYLSVIPTLFSRFDSITKLTVRCNRTMESTLDDYALCLIARKCHKLIWIHLRGCRNVTEIGMAALGVYAKGLKKFVCGSCTFGVNGMNALLNNCSSLEELFVKSLDGLKKSGGEMIGPGVASSLKFIQLKGLDYGQCFMPLIVGSKKLRSLKLLQCSGDWDNVLKMVASRENSCLFEVYLDNVLVSDVGISALSNCLELEILHIIKIVDCTNVGIVSVLEKCRLLRKLRIDGWSTDQIGEQGLASIGKHGAKLQELVLNGVNPSLISIEAIALGCKKLERLSVCHTETVADAELSCIAAKCAALKKLQIRSCPISDEGIEAFVQGCPNLEKLIVKRCPAVTSEAEALLRLNRRSLVIDINVCELEAEAGDASVRDAGRQEDEGEVLPIVNQEVAGTANSEASSSKKGRAWASNRKFGLFGVKCFGGCL